MVNIDIEHIIAKSLSGEISPDEIIILSNWLAADKRNKDEYKQIKEYWDSEVSLSTQADPAKDFALLMQRIKQNDNRSKQKTSLIRYFTIAIAAAITAILVYTMFFDMVQTNNIDHYSYVSGNSVADFILPDSTHITLNKNSTLTYTSAYNNDEREVTLVGEAYFDVRKDETRKFIVNAGKSRIIVLGTIFSVTNKAEDNTIITSLLEGSVKFKFEEQDIVLKPEERVTLDKISNNIEISKFDPEIETAWTESLIRYKSLTFFELIAMLEKQYDVKIIMPPKEQQLTRLSGSIDANMTIEQVLDLLKKNIPYKWQKTNESYIITYQ